MSIITFIRKNGKFTVGTIVVISLFFFVLGQGMSGIMSIISKRNTNDYVILKVNKDKVTYQEYDKRFNQIKNNFYKHLSHPPTDQDLDLIHKLVKENIINQKSSDGIYKEEFNILRLNIPDYELINMVQGNRIHKIIKNIFKDPNTGNFSKNILTSHMKSLPNQPREIQLQWKMMEDGLVFKRMMEKIENMIINSIYVTNLEIKKEDIYEYTSLDLKCLYVPYQSIPDSSININDTMMNSYLNNNKEKYKVEESKDVMYVEYPILPSKEDITEFETEITSIKEEFSKTKDDIHFAKNHTDGSEMDIFLTFPSKELKKILPNRRKWRKGVIIGPLKDEYNTYKIYKISNILRQGKNRSYEMAVIEKHLVAGDTTKDNILSKADIFASKIKRKEDFEKIAKENNLTIKYASKIKKSTKRINNLEDSRKIVKWLFKKDKVFPVFHLDNSKYIVAAKTGEYKAGTATLEDVKEEIKQQLLKEEKAKLIISKLRSTNETQIEKMADAFGKEASIIDINNLKFRDDSIDKIGEIRKATGIAFSLQKSGDISSPFKEENGVIIFELINRNNPDPAKDVMHKKVDIKTLENMEPYALHQAIKDNIKIIDNTLDYY